MKKGFLKLFVLANLEREPLHGYGIIQRISRKSNGFWQPKPGNLYPLLKEMAEEGLIDTIASQVRKRKKPYSITQKGEVELLRLLNESQEVVNNLVRTMSRENDEGIKMHIRLVKELSPQTYRQQLGSLLSTLEALIQLLSKTKAVLKAELGMENEKKGTSVVGLSKDGGW